MLQVEKIKKLKSLIIEIDNLQPKKNRIVKEQKYEEAAELRDKERKLYKEIDELAELDKTEWLKNYKKKQFLMKDKITRRVVEDFYDVLRYIHDDDTNLTPALLRKKSEEIKTYSNKEGAYQKRQAELEQELRQRSFWIKITQYRPILAEIADNRFVKRSEELLALYATEGGGQEVCIARYIEENTGIHDVKYYFENQRGEKIVLNDIKGWQYMPGFESTWNPIR